MPGNDNKELLNVLDNLEEFSGKLLAQIANDSEGGRLHLLQSIQNAEKEYSKPIEAHLTGWLYYFSRVRGQEIIKAIEDLTVGEESIERLEVFKHLIQTGEWNVGSYNYYLFLELIRGVPGYEPLLRDDKTEITVITRLQTLLLKKIDTYISEFKLNQRVVKEREASRHALQQNNDALLNKVELSGNLLSAQNAAKLPYKKTSFYLIKEDQWKLFWVDISGTAISLNLNQELESYLNDQKILNIEKVHVVAAKRIKKECLKIRDAFFENAQVLINPKDLKGEGDLSNKKLCAQGITNSFVVRGKEGRFSIHWINTLSKAMNIALVAYPELNEFLAGQNKIEGEDCIQLKFFLSQVKTTKAVGMSDFKEELQNCLLKRSPPKERQVAPRNRLDLSIFKDLEHCIEKQVGKTKKAEEPVNVVAPKRKLNLSQYEAVATLFSHQAHQAADAVIVQKPDDSLTIIENYIIS